MEAAIVDIFILRAACSAHGKLSHRGAAAVVRDVAHDRETRSAVRAIDEGIEIPAIGGVKQFTEAVITDRNIRRDQCANRLARVTGENLELTVAIAGKFADGNSGYAGKSWRFPRQAQEKVFHGLGRPLNFDCDAGGGIADRPGQIEFGGEPEDVRAEPDSLHDSGNSDFPANLHKGLG